MGGRMVSMSPTILISTGARLHFGFFAHCGAEPPPGSLNYGGVGLMIDSPGFVVVASEIELAASKDDRDHDDRCVWVREWEPHEFQIGCNVKNAQAVESGPFAGPSVEAWPALAYRGADFILYYRTRCSVGNQPPCCQIDLRSAIPSHRGLGAGTQLGMAVAKALSLLSGKPDIDSITLARWVGRGARSAIGIHGFERGGFLVDAGKERDEQIGRLEARVDVPADWRFLLVNPPDAASGLSGEAESAALERLPATSVDMTERLRRLAMAEMLPALSTGDCNRFGEAVFEFGQLVGEYFRPIQGGIYSTPQSAELVEWIRGEGYRGVAQTSWGPTLAVCCVDHTSAQLLRAKMQADARWRECRAHVAIPLNTGAKIRQVSSADTQ
jgi:beta-ribofuranosylaminobenzene 5'-phosphate synthase